MQARSNSLKRALVAVVDTCVPQLLFADIMPFSLPRLLTAEFCLCFNATKTSRLNAASCGYPCGF